MNHIKVNVYKKVMKKIAEKSDGAEDFIKNRIDEICCQERLSAKAAIVFMLTFYIYFLCWPF